MSIIAIAFGAIFVSNVVLNQFYGLCPFLGVSTKKSSALSMGLAVTFVITLSTMIAYTIYHQVLVPNNIEYLSTIVFILVIASFVQLVEMLIKRFSATVYSALGVYLPLITTNCAVLGVAILALGLENGSLLKAVFFAIANSLGFALALIVFASIREHLELANIPKGMKGVPINLLVAGLLSLAFLGFTGLV